MTFFLLIMCFWGTTDQRAQTNFLPRGPKVLSAPLPVTTLQQDTSELAGVFGVSEDGVSVGDWLLVNFAPEGSRLKAYLGRVESITRRGNGKFEASFLRRKTQRLCDKDLFAFPDQEDVCAFSYQKVIGRVEAPEVLRRGVLKFSVDFHELVRDNEASRNF